MLIKRGKCPLIKLLVAMDPLQKLAERNRKHAEINKKERRENLKLYPIALLFYFLYFGGYYFYFSNEEQFLSFEFWELTKQVWLISMVTIGGIGSIFFSASLAILIWLNIFVKELGAKVNLFRSGIFSVISISISYSFFLFAKWLNIFIIENNKNIYEFLSVDFPGMVFMVETGLYYIVGIISMIFLMLFFFISSIPFKAKKHAQEFATNKALKSDS